METVVEVSNEQALMSRRTVVPVSNSYETQASRAIRTLDTAVAGAGMAEMQGVDQAVRNVSAQKWTFELEEPADTSSLALNF